MGEHAQKKVVILGLINEILEDDSVEKLLDSTDEDDVDKMYQTAILKYNAISKRIDRGMLV